jgi:DNA-binding transcriptional ArsR family regulator
MSQSTASTDIFQAIADPTRRAILDRLQHGEQPVKHLAEPFAMSLPAISQHLQVLTAAGLVIQHRRGRQRIYRLNPASLQPVSEWVSQYERFWTAKLDALGEYLEEQP